MGGAGSRAATYELYEPGKLESLFGMVLVGGEDLGRPMTYQDIEPGRYSLCVSVRYAGAPPDAAAVRCATYTVAPSPADQTFAVELP